MPVRDFGTVTIFCLICAPMLWGGNFVVGSLLASEIPGLWMNVLRWLVALGLLLPLVGYRAWQNRRALTRAWRSLCLLGGLGIAGFNSVLYLALQHATVSTTAIAFAVTPFLILAMTSALDRAWPRARLLLASAIALSGMTLAQWHALSSDVSMLGVGLTFAAAVIWAAYCVALKRVTLPVPASVGFLGQIATGTLMLIPVAWMFAPALSTDMVRLPTLAGIAYLGLCAGALAFWLWQHAIARAGAAHASLFMNIVPLSSVVLSTVLLGDPLEQVELLAFAIVGSGLALSFFTSRPAIGKLSRSNTQSIEV